MMLFCLALIIPVPASFGARTYWYQPENMTNISGRAYADSAGGEFLKFRAVTFGWGSDGVSTPITAWNSGQKTTVSISAPLKDHQRGRPGNNYYGASTVAIDGTGMSCWHSTYSLVRGLHLGASECQGNVKFPATDTYRPFASGTKGLAMAFYLKIPYVKQGDSPTYFSVGLRFVDKITGKGISVGNYLYDSRNRWVENIGWDIGMNTGYVCSFVGSPTRLYFDATQGAHHGGAETWKDWQYYQFNIKPYNLLNAIRNINTKYGAGLSEDLTRYRLAYVQATSVISWPSGTNLNGEIASAMKNLNVWLFDL
jgi:hypothetical protein